MSEQNDLLRAHVTRVGFDLSLGKTHIAALVYLDQCLKQKRYIPHRVQDLSFPDNTQLPARAFGRAFSMFATGMHGCQDRGLVIHHWNPKHKNDGLKWHYTITKAGKIVIALLSEAGIYQEYADALPRLEVVA